ncbi:nucleic acid-binding protein, partial [Tothia fuscella]
RQVVGVVVSAGKMMKTVKVQIPKQKWNKRIQKNYPIPYNVLVSDPTESTREGDVVSIQSGLRTSPKVNHVVSDIIAPMGPPLSQRPRLPTPEERMAAMIARKEAR